MRIYNVKILIGIKTRDILKIKMLFGRKFGMSGPWFKNVLHHRDPCTRKIQEPLPRKNQYTHLFVTCL